MPRQKKYRIIADGKLAGGGYRTLTLIADDGITHQFKRDWIIQMPRKQAAKFVDKQQTIELEAGTYGVVEKLHCTDKEKPTMEFFVGGKGLFILNVLDMVS